MWKYSRGYDRPLKNGIPTIVTEGVIAHHVATSCRSPSDVI